MTPQTPPTDRPLTAGDENSSAPAMLRQLAKLQREQAGWANRLGQPGCPARLNAADNADALAWAVKKLSNHNANLGNMVIPRPATSAASEVEGVERTIDGETVLGFKVAAWRYLGPEDDARFGYRLCEHWSTPGNHPQKVERLFTETQLRAALASPPVSERERELEGALAKARSIIRIATDDAEDEGDRVYFGSTNHLDLLRKCVAEIEARVLTAQPAGEGK